MNIGDLYFNVENSKVFEVVCIIDDLVSIELLSNRLSTTVTTFVLNVKYKKIEVPYNAIICAACRSKDGIVVKGHRHFDSSMLYTIKYLEMKVADFRKEQGFVDMFNNYLTREQAKIVFDKNKQYDKYALDKASIPENYKYVGDMLFSEHLY